MRGLASHGSRDTHWVPGGTVGGWVEGIRVEIGLGFLADKAEVRFPGQGCRVHLSSCSDGEPMKLTTQSSANKS